MIEPVAIPINYIERKPDSRYYRVIGKGITVEFLSRFIDNPDWPMQRIAEGYGLTPAEIHAAWSFYYDHKAEIDAHIAEQTADFEAHTEESRAQKAELIRKYEARTGNKWTDT